jgi:hypothetical protein
MKTMAIVAAGAALVAVNLLPAANAAPDGFPDLDGFAPVDAAAFTRPFSYAERWTSGYVFFRTPDGISCAIGGSSWCTGALPGLPADQQSLCASVRQGADGSAPFRLGQSDQPCVPTADNVLNPGQKLINNTYEITCAVGEDNLTACIDTRNDHGFVVKPSGSWTF